MEHLKLFEEYIDYNTYDFNKIVDLIKNDVLLISKEYDILTDLYDKNNKQVSTLQFNRDLKSKGFDVEQIISKLANIIEQELNQFEKNKRLLILNSLTDFLTRKISQNENENENVNVYLVIVQIISKLRYRIVEHIKKFEKYFYNLDNYQNLQKVKFWLKELNADENIIQDVKNGLYDDYIRDKFKEQFPVVTVAKNIISAWHKRKKK